MIAGDERAEVDEMKAADNETNQKKYGMATLVYHHDKGYQIEGKDRLILGSLFSDPVIVQSITSRDVVVTKEPAFSPDGEPSDDPEDESDVECFSIGDEAVDQVKQRSVELGYPLFEEYDFKSDKGAPSLPNTHLNTHTRIRSYQSQALSQVLGNGRARSGMVVLPCGAGKSLTGVVAANTIGKSVLCLTTTSFSVRQWKNQFQQWTTIPTSHLEVFTSDHKPKSLPENCVLVTTYQMISISMMGQQRRGRSESKSVMDWILERQWGLLLMDEAHVVPAPEYRRAVRSLKARCKLGLTATMVREDEKITDLYTLIGPKLYEANWLDLTAQGYLANVKCWEVWCPMTEPFQRAYQNEPNARRKMLLSFVNPRKLRAVELLVRHHEAQGDKIIVFSDSIFTLEICAKMLQRPYLYGQTKEWERQLVLETFRKDTKEIQTICLSKVGDEAIDLPQANVVLQVTSNDGGRRQEAQRLGRILRPKFGTGASFDAMFYTLVSTNTREMTFCGKRQQYLIDQGYTYEVVKELCTQSDDLAVKEKYAFATPADDQELLAQALQEMKKSTTQEKSPARKRHAASTLETRPRTTAKFRALLKY